MVAQRQDDSPWVRVTKSAPCPICDHSDWCEVNADGTVAHCMRESNGGPEWEYRQGGWLHPLSRPTPLVWPQERPTRQQAPVPTCADKATLHAVYTRVLALFPVTPTDCRYLIEKAGYSAALLDMEPTPCATIPYYDAQAVGMTMLEEEFGRETLLHVPGFALKQGRLRLIIPGLVIASRDREGRIQGLQVRKGPSDYRWESGDGGPSCGAPVHLARPHNRRDPRVVYLVESAKTANMVAERQGALTIGLGGLTNGHVQAREILDHLRQEEEVDVAVILLDAVNPADPEATRKEEMTALQRDKLAALARDLGYAVRYGQWTYMQGKGPDDVLIGGTTFRLACYTIGTVEATRDGCTDSVHPSADTLVDELKGVILNPATKPPQAQTYLTWRVLRAEAERRGDDPDAVSIAEIAKHAKVSRNTAATALKHYQTTGYIAVEQETRKNTETGLPYLQTRITPIRPITRFDEIPEPPHLAKEKERKKRCPKCGSDLLRVHSYQCTSGICDHICTAEEAEEAGERLTMTAEGYVVDQATGEVVTPPKDGCTGSVHPSMGMPATPPVHAACAPMHPDVTSFCTTDVHPADMSDWQRKRLQDRAAARGHQASNDYKARAEWDSEPVDDAEPSPAPQVEVLPLPVVIPEKPQGPCPGCHGRRYHLVDSRWGPDWRCVTCQPPTKQGGAS